jgi:hypothetical protein
MQVDRLSGQDAAGGRKHKATFRLHLETMYYIGGSGKMAPQLCQKCKQAHPGRVCDYDENGECAETIGVNEVAQPRNQPSTDEEDLGSLRSGAIERPL